MMCDVSTSVCPDYLSNSRIVHVLMDRTTGFRCTARVPITRQPEVFAMLGEELPQVPGCAQQTSTRSRRPP